MGGGSGSAREALDAERAEARERLAGLERETRQRLAAEQTEARERLAGLEREFAGIVSAADSANTDDEHDPEGATIAFERQHVVALIGQARDQQAAIDAALRRLHEGGYGQCERCGQPIAPERLAARPTATRCVSCAGKR